MFLIACWDILCELAPWLLLGMLLSGLLHVWLPKDFIRKNMRGRSGVLAAVGLGVPLPLCSCGVIPAGIGLKNDGASHGAAVGFLISTPQTGIDSVLVSASLLGWPFAIFKMVTAAITGILGGWLTDWLVDEDDGEQVTPESQPISEHPSQSIRWLEVFRHGIVIIRSIWIWLVIGIAVSALINVAVPETWFDYIGQWGLLPAMLLMLLVSLPMYVCATASVPIAASIVAGGFPPAAALVFLMAGPATNVSTMGAIHSRFGGRTLAIYLGTIMIGSMGFAWLFDLLIPNLAVTKTVVGHDHQTWWSILSALILLTMILYFVVQRIQQSFYSNPVSPSSESNLVQLGGGNMSSSTESQGENDEE